MSAHKSNESGPGKDESNCGEVSLRVAVCRQGVVRGEEQGGDKAEGDQLQPVLTAEDVPLERHHHLKTLPEGDQREEDGEDDRHGSSPHDEQEDDCSDDEVLQPTGQKYLQFNSLPNEIVCPQGGGGSVRCFFVGCFFCVG